MDRNYNSEQRRYVPDDISDKVKDGDIEKLETLSVKDWVAKNKLASLFLFLASVAAIIVFWRFSALFVTILTNIWLYVGLGLILVLAITFYFGRSSHRQSLKSKDKVDIDLGSTAVSFQGDLENTQNGKVFYPIVDSSLFSDTYLKIRDVGSKLTRVTGVNKTPDDRIGIHIPSDVSKRVDDTPYGEEILALGSELKPIASGGIPRLQLKRPQTVGEDSYNKLRREYNKLEREYESLEYELETAEVETQRAIKRARKKEDDITQRKHNEMVELLEAISFNNSRNDRSDSEMLQIGGTDD